MWVLKPGDLFDRRFRIEREIGSGGMAYVYAARDEELHETVALKIIKPELVGEKRQWYAADHDDSKWTDIRVDECWENQGHANYDSAAWYRLNVELPKHLDGRIVQLCFGAADENAKVYVNGRLSGER